MPKKSNKTAHVLSLLTNGGGELLEENISLPKAKNEPEQNSSSRTSETLKKEVIVEMQGSARPDSLSDLVKSDLEKELGKNLNKKSKNSSLIEEKDTEKNDRPPYSPTFMSKFGIVSSHENKAADEKDIPVSLDQVKSELYILENFNDEEEIEFMESKPITPLVSTLSSDAVEKYEATYESTKVLHNLAEDVIRAKAPEIMKSFNMCTCQDCIFDVVALALNNTKPLYTVTDRGQLFQKLASYEHQYGTDLASEITKACIKVKINPRHPHPNQK